MNQPPPKLPKFYWVSSLLYNATIPLFLGALSMYMMYGHLTHIVLDVALFFCSLVGKILAQDLLKVSTKKKMDVAYRKRNLALKLRISMLAPTLLGIIVMNHECPAFSPLAWTLFAVILFLVLVEMLLVNYTLSLILKRE